MKNIQKRMTKSTWKQVSFVLGLVVVVLTLFDYLGLLPTQLLTPQSTLHLDVATQSTRELSVYYGRENINEIFNPLAQDLTPVQLHLWLDNIGGRTTIYTQTIIVTAENFWTSIIDEQQYELKPGETKSIPLKFTPRDEYWFKRTNDERENARLRITAKVVYTTKRETKVAEFKDVHLMDSLNEYYSRINSSTLLSSSSNHTLS